MDIDLPRRPPKPTREQSRRQKEHAKLFFAALKSQARSAGWRYANCGIFRQQADWFVDVLPSPLWERGAWVSLRKKPMALDPLFWSIVGLEENNRLPLSFRANGAWVLRPPAIDVHLALHEDDPSRLAASVLEWSTAQGAGLEAGSVESMICEIQASEERRRHFVALEICLRLLLSDLEGAEAMCKPRFPHDAGGFQTGSLTFFNQAKAWIAARD
jgi:hypothetical protein